MMVYKMGQEVGLIFKAFNDFFPLFTPIFTAFTCCTQDRAHARELRSNGPLPEEISFVAAARDTIPPARVTTAMARWRGPTRRRGFGRGQAETQSGARGRVTGKSKKRSVDEPGSSDPAPVPPRGRARRNSNNTAPEHTQLSDLNEAVADEVQITQNAPDVGT